MKLAFCLIFAAVAFGGCAVVLPDPAAAVADWTRGQGGEVADARLERVRAIGESLPADQLAVPLRFHVLSSSGLAAYSWDTGDIFLSAGLVDAATDGEMAAAIAHEIGHLINAGNMSNRSAAGLRGNNASLSVEEAADATGITLLQKTSRPPAALLSLLTKVRAASASASSKEEIQQRINLLRRRVSLMGMARDQQIYRA